jgi:hypothetical protein
MAPKTRIDYDSIESDWRAGIKTPKQLAAEYTERTGEKATRQAIIKHFEVLNIPRDLSAKIQARADAIVAESIVANSIAPATKAAIVEANAQDIAAVKISHRKDVNKARALVARLWDKLNEQVESCPELDKLGELMLDSEATFDKLNDIYRKVIAFPSLVDSVKKLSDALKTLVTLESDVYGIKDPQSRPSSNIENMSRDELIAIAKGTNG